MKCPECDSIQPDNAALCSKCGLSFAAWNTLNTEPAKKRKTDEDEGMTFPAPQEDEPAPEEKFSAEPLKASNSQEKTSKVEAKNKKGVYYFAGAVFAFLVTAGFFLNQKNTQTIPPVVITSPTTVTDFSPSPTPTQTPLIPTFTPVPVAAPVRLKPTKTATPLPQASPLETQPISPPPTFTPIPATPVEKAEPVATSAPTGDEPVTLEISSEEETPSPTLNASLIPTTTHDTLVPPAAPAK